MFQVHNFVLSLTTIKQGKQTCCTCCQLALSFKTYKIWDFVNNIYLIYLLPVPPKQMIERKTSDWENNQFYSHLSTTVFHTYFLTVDDVLRMSPQTSIKRPILSSLVRGNNLLELFSLSRESKKLITKFVNFLYNDSVSVKCINKAWEREINAVVPDKI